MSNKKQILGVVAWRVSIVVLLAIVCVQIGTIKAELDSIYSEIPSYSSVNELKFEVDKAAGRVVRAVERIDHP